MPNYCRSKNKIQKKETSQVNGSESHTVYLHFNREVHKKVCEARSCYLKETVIENKEVWLLVNLNQNCQHLLTEFGGDEFIDVTSSSQKLGKWFRKYNGDDILIYSRKSRKGN